MNEDKFIMFRNRLSKVHRHLGKQARRLGIRAYRLYDHDLPEFPLCIECYEEAVSVAEYKRQHGMEEEAHDEWMEKTLEIVMEVLQVPREHIFLRLRQRKPGRLGQYQRLEKGEQKRLVQEGGLTFRINLSDYLDTGLFLDHRITRGMVREQSARKRVLNLFAYTGSFSVYAAAGGASEVVTVDLSNTYLQWAAENMSLNGFTDPDKYKFIQADVKQFLPSIPSGTFDIIIMDPPTFSNSQRMKDILDIQRDHPLLINQCLDALKEGGLLYFSTNFRKFKMDTTGINTTLVKDITRQTTPFDFEGKLWRYCYLLEK